MSSRRTLVVGQSGGGTAVINSSLAGVIEAARASGFFEQVLGLVHGVEGLLSGDAVPLDDLSHGQIETLAATPAAALGSCRYKLRAADEATALAQLDAWDAAAFLYIGGDDSARTTARIAALAAVAGRPLAAVAIPKTIDNDLPAMDHTPGYGSAAKAFAAYVRDVAVDAVAMRRVEPVRIVEAKGRDSGWLTLAAGLARPDPAGRGAPHLLLPPERVFDPDDFAGRVEACLARDGYCVAVVAETVRDAAGNLLGQGGGEDFVDAFGHRYTEGPGPYLSRLVEKRLKVRARFDRPGTWLKTAGLIASAVDRAEARAVGREAVGYALAHPAGSARLITVERESDTPYRVSYGSTPLDNVIGRVKLVPDAWLPAPDEPIHPDFITYLQPLLGGPLPDYLRLIN